MIKVVQKQDYQDLYEENRLFSEFPFSSFQEWTNGVLLELCQPLMNEDLTKK
jgi:hypothetical protein